MARTAVREGASGSRKRTTEGRTAPSTRSSPQRERLLLELYERAPHLSDSELYDFVLSKAVSLTHSTVGFLHFVTEDQQFIDLTTWNKGALKTCSVPPEVARHYPVDLAGNWADCVRESRPIIYNDYATSPHRRGLPEGHTEITRFMSIPVAEDGVVRIIFGVGNKKSAYGDADVVQIQLVAEALKRVLEQRRAEREIRRSEQLLQEAQRLAHLGSWELDLVHNVLSWSDEIFRIFEIDPERFGASYEAFIGAIHPDDRSMVDKAYTDSLKDRTPYEIEHRLRMRDGRVKHVLERCVTHYDDAGEPVRSVGTVQDVTERVAARESLQQQYSTMRAIASSANALIFSVDREYRYMAFNEGHAAVMRDIYGARIEIGHSILEYTSVDADRAAAKANIDRALEGEDVIEEAYSGLDAERRFFRVSHSPVKRDTGEVIGVAISAQDLTDRKHVEEALTELNREMKAISECNQLLVRAVDEQSLLNDICRVICDDAGYRMAWVGFSEHDRAKTVRPIAWAGETGGFLDAPATTWSDTVRGRGPTGTAIRSGEVVCIQDVLTDPRTAPWRTAAAQQGYRSCLAMPLEDESSAAFGALTIYSAQPDAFNASEVRLLGELAADLAFGITALRARAERERAQEARRASDARFAAAFDATPDLIAVTRLDDGTIVEVNEAYTRLLGYSRAESIGATTSDLRIWVRPEDRAAFIAALRDTGEVDGLETQLRRKDGSVVTVIDSARVLEFGDAACVLSIARDISGRKAAEEAQRRSELAYRRIVDTATEGIWAVGPDAATVYVNASMAEMLGYHPDELIGRPLTDFMLEEDVPNQLERMEARRKGIAEHYERRFRRRDGRILWTLASGTPVFDEEGAFDGSLAMFADITDRKLAEQNLRLLNRELRAISDCNQMLMRAENEQTLLEDICRIVCDEAGYRMAWVGFAEHDRGKTVRPVAWAGHENGYLAAVEFSWADTKRGRNVSGSAIRTGSTFSVEDIATSPLVGPWRKEALQRGYRSAIGLPLKDDQGAPFGALCIYSAEPGALAPAEVRLLEELAGDLAFGITTLRTRAKSREAERACRVSEERFRDVFNNSTDVLYLLEVTKEGSFRNLEVNPAFEVSTGLSRAQVIGKLQEEVVDAEVASVVNAKYRKAVAAGRPIEEEVQLDLPSGRKYYRSALIPLFDSGGAVDRILGVSHDITDRREAENAQREAALYARGLIEASLDPMVTISPEGRITDVNLSTEKATGLSRSELIGTDFAAYFTDPDRASAGYQKVLAEGTVRDYPLTLKHTSGGAIDVLYNASTYVDGEGNLQGVLAAARDITQLERARSETRGVLLQLVEVIALTLEKRDPYTAGHQKRVAQLASAIAEHLGLDATTVEGVRLGATIHDIGKIYVPSEILSRPGRLTPPEWQIIQTHPSVGAEIVHGVQAPWPIEQMIAQHHERLNGSGYPLGLIGDAICHEARILAVADVVEAMASHRPYRPAVGIDSALQEVERGRDTLFDGRVVEACLDLFVHRSFEFDS